MNQSFVLDEAPELCHLHGTVLVNHNLLRYSLAHHRSGNFQNAIPAMQDPEIVPDEEIARLHHKAKEVSIPAHDFLERPVGSSSFLEVVIR
jgi:hypothetical protein